MIIEYILYVTLWIAIGVLADYAGYVKGHTTFFNKESLTIFGVLSTILIILTLVFIL